MTPTPDQLRDAERLRRYIRRSSLTSCMNDTKWREAIAAIGSISGFRPRFRIRCVRDRADHDPPLEASFPWHVSTYVEIEWLDLDPVVRVRQGAIAPDRVRDFSTELIAVLKAVPVPVSIEDGLVRIWGYLRAGSTQDLV